MKTAKQLIEADYSSKKTGADKNAYDLIAKVSNPGSFYYLKSSEQINTEDMGTKDRKILDALFKAQKGNEDYSIGYLSAMFLYGGLKISDLMKALKFYYEKTHDEGPMHDAY